MLPLLMISGALISILPAGPLSAAVVPAEAVALMLPLFSTLWAARASDRAGDGRARARGLPGALPAAPEEVRRWLSRVGPPRVEVQLALADLHDVVSRARPESVVRQCLGLLEVQAWRTPVVAQPLYERLHRKPLVRWI